ncbi:hypothetical protein [Nocardioides sp. zg-1228]|uniref:hypothetical protein n=1 Tax=Nocardioides sp. zg-1228 TaxID=2763008 RepID=UPI001642F021|nr:hypothetical protein [Nocardioides sp. zg-1228]MBC2933913.1 hypothetical protein [Nocardioides sp. zg-1228]QSF58678.1 hypothetical protein JX575_05660 [Nocardioides sp. zg-1228]
MRPYARGAAASAVGLRVLVLVLPCAALALALPEVPHWAVVGGVVLSAAGWALLPDHAIGVVPLVLVGGWWAAHGVVDGRILVVAVLLVAAHVAATLASYGPPTLALDRRLARLWLGRGLLALVPVLPTWVAVRGLDPALAPSWVWLATGLVTVGLLLVTGRLTRPEVP